MRACNLQGAGGRARSPTPWGGTSQETPYLAYGPELDTLMRRATELVRAGSLYSGAFDECAYTFQRAFKIFHADFAAPAVS